MKPSRIFIVLLLIVLVLLQYKLWISPDGVPQYWRLKRQVTAINAENIKLQTKNLHVVSEIENLKQSNEAIEEHARNDLGLVKSDEVFYQVMQ